ncbi:MAG: DoxX family protein [Verrucomicrobiales bacterium]
MKIWWHPEITRFRGAPLTAVVTLLSRLIVAAVFIYAGVLKALDPQEFLLDVRSFQVLGDPWAAVMAVGLPWLEIVGGIALVLGGWSRSACLVLGGLLLVFAGAFLQAWARGVDVTCGCFGKTENKTDFAQSLTIDAVLLALTALVWWGRSRLESQQGRE